MCSPAWLIWTQDTVRTDREKKSGRFDLVLLIIAYSEMILMTFSTGEGYMSWFRIFRIIRLFRIVRAPSLENRNVALLLTMHDKPKGREGRDSDLKGARRADHRSRIWDVRYGFQI